MQKGLPLAIILLTIAAAAIFLVVGLPRLTYPYEVHWLEGSIVDQISWMLSGKPLYGKPTMEYVSWLYGPGYYYIAAGISDIAGISFVSARLPSVLATMGTIVLFFYTIKRETSSLTAAISMVGLYLAAYVKTEMNMLHARVDPLFVFFVAASLITIYYSTSWKSILLGSILLTFGYFTKQTSVVFVLGIAVYLWKVKGWKDTLIFVGSLTAFVALGSILIDWHYDGWYSYYTITLPSAGKSKTVEWWPAISGFLSFAVIRCWPITIFLFYFTIGRLLNKTDRTQAKDPVLLFGMFAVISSLLGFVGILNQGGNHNVFLPLAAAGSIYLPILLYRTSAKPFAAIWHIAIPIQILLLLSNPWSSNFNIATEEDRVKQERFNSYVASLDGEVWIPFHGHVWKYTGKKPYADLNALRDVLLVEDSIAGNLQREYDSVLANHRFNHILSDIPTSYPHYRLFDSLQNDNRVWMTLITDSLGKYLISDKIYRYIPE